MTELTKRNTKILFLRTNIVEMDSPNNHNDWVKYEIILLFHIDLYINYKHEYVPDNECTAILYFIFSSRESIMIRKFRL